LLKKLKREEEKVNKVQEEKVALSIYAKMLDELD